VWTCTFGFSAGGILFTAWMNDAAALFRKRKPNGRRPDLTREARGHLHSWGYDGARRLRERLATDEPLLKHLRKNHSKALDRNALKTGNRR